jgi:DNA invertase Pin-like site-specific DNA recombinase
MKFGALVRVSTERQEKQGESLVVQRKAIERDVAKLGGTIAGWYGGQEHATDGWERKEVDRLIADAGRGKFDAVIVAYDDRWSRDNAKSKEGLEAFRQNRIRFFVGCQERNLRSPQDIFFLGMTAEVGEFVAGTQNKKSIESRIERARKGRPAVGALPFGRAFDKVTGQWHVIPEKQAMIREAAARYLAGESLPKLAREYGVNHANLCKVFRERCGETWVQEFHYPRFDIDEKVVTVVPRLLDDETIKRLRYLLAANRQFLHRPPRSKYNYLLAGRVFCAECGYALVGHLSGDHKTGRGVRRYYHHVHGVRDRECPLRPRPCVPADKLEAEVLRQLYDLVGNPAKLALAIKASVPDCDASQKRQSHLEEELARIGRAREKVLSLIAKDLITEVQAEKQLADLKEREAYLRDELGRLTDALADVPTGETVDHWREWLDAERRPFEEMDDHDRRVLLAAVFDMPLADGRPAGVYVSLDGDARPHRPKQWAITIRGRLDFELVMSRVQPSPATSIAIRSTSVTARTTTSWRRPAATRGCAASPTVSSITSPG